MLISGAFVITDCWGGWKPYFESHGYTVVMPAWPYKDGTVHTLRARYNSSSIPAQYDLTYVVNYHAALIDALPEKPILIGHSFGGLIVQLLLQRDKGAVGVAYHPAPPQGVFVYKLSFLKALWGPLGVLRPISEPFLMSFTQWQFSFTNGMPLQEQKHYYDTLVVPETRRVLRAALGQQGFINFKKAHVPLLIIAGSTDTIIPAALNKKNYDRYKKHEPAGCITHYKEFKGRNHLSMCQPNWQQGANYILNWISKHN